MDDKLRRDSLALGIAVGIFGIPFGVLAVASDIPIVMASAMSAFVFAGGSQFAALGVIAAGGSPAAAVISGLMLNGRYVAFGMALAPLLTGSPAYRATASQFVIDESSAFALSRRDDPPQARRAFWTTGLTAFVLWNAGTLIGAVVGDRLGDPKTLGLDAAFPAGFLALIVPLLQTRRNRVAALGGAVLAVALTPLVPPGGPILIASLGAVAAIWIPEDAPATQPPDIDAP